MRGIDADSCRVIAAAIFGDANRKGDFRFFDIVRWIAFAQIAAEQFGVTRQNIAPQERSTDPDIRRLLGVEANLGGALGLSAQWAREIIAQVGNYGEMWERNITPMGMERCVSRLWMQGGLAFAPPLR
jgi:general L-amino acid transport system substrate-binding protein